MNKSILFLLATLLLGQPIAIAKKNQKELPPSNTIENLLRPPKVYNMSMSPDGKYAASVAPIGKKGDKGIVIFDLKTMEIKRSFNWGGREIERVTWTTDEDVAFSLSKWGLYVDGVYSVNVNRDEVYTLLKDDAVISFMDPVTDEPYSWIWIKDGIDMNKSLAKIRATGDARSNPNGDDSFIPNTNENPLISNRIKEPNGQIYWWYIDRKHEPRIVTRFLDGKIEYLHRYNKKGQWTALPLDPELWDIEIFGEDQSTIYISGYNGKNTKGLYSYNIDTNKIGKVIFRDDYYDFSDSSKYLYYKDKIVGFRYMRDTHAFVWLAPEMKNIQKMIDGALNGKTNVIYDSSDDFTRHLIYSYSNTAPAEYVLLDLKDKTLKEVAKTAPWLEHDKLAKTEVFHFKTSDGLQLEGYLTKPNGAKGPLPTICLVHGGPWTRDIDGFDSETQLLASQGYAVLRVNYRGSTGYGKQISNDNAYEFRKMHNDITEAVQMAVKNGITDPNRIAVMGASFGGYAALCGAAFEPDLYRCAITNMGVFDWEEMTKSRKQQKRQYSYHKLVEAFGDPRESSDKFHDISPINHVDQIKIPIFVIHGKQDSNVSIKQSKKLKSELIKHGVVHETYFVSGEGHNLFGLKKRVKTYKSIIAFLDKHMK